MNCRFLCYHKPIELCGRGRYQRKTYVRHQCLLGLQSVSRCLVGSACWGKQVAHYSQEKKEHLTDKGSKHGRTRWMEGSLEVSRRWVVTFMFLAFSKMTKHIGEEKKARQENGGFWRLRKAPAVIYLRYCRGKQRHIPDPESICSTLVQRYTASTTVLSSLKLCHQALALHNDSPMRGADVLSLYGYAGRSDRRDPAVESYRWKCGGEEEETHGYAQV